MQEGAEPASWPADGAAPAVADGPVTGEPEPAQDQAPPGPAEPPDRAEDTSADFDPITYEADEPYSFSEDRAIGYAGAPDYQVPGYQAPGYEARADAAPEGVGYQAPGYEARADAAPEGVDYQAPGYQARADAPQSEDLAGISPDAGYNDHMSPPAPDGPAVPPYPAELPGPGVTAALAGQPGAAGRTAPRPAPARPRSAATARRANLTLARLEPWSVMKFSFLMSLVAWVVLFVAVAILYYVLARLGVFAALGRTLQSVTSSQGSSGVDITKWTSASRVLGYTMLIGAANVVVITALSTIGAMIYNLVTHLGGGVEITLRETD